MEAVFTIASPLLSVVDGTDGSRAVGEVEHDAVAPNPVSSAAGRPGGGVGGGGRGCCGTKVFRWNLQKLHNLSPLSYTFLG